MTYIKPHDAFTIHVLLYGNHLDLAERCLLSLIQHCEAALPQNLRLGCNAIGKGTRKFVDELTAQGWLLRENIWDSTQNIHKYPLMRKMFYDPKRPIRTPYVMWFDDDSFVRDDTFLIKAADALATRNRANRLPDMLGSVYNIPLRETQRDWIKDQSWYANKPIEQRVRFATGGWWAIRTELLKKYNYPWPELDHRGGDVMLGQLLQQQGLVLQHFRDGVAINADEHGRESKAQRRGFDQAPIGTHYQRERRQQTTRVAAPQEAAVNEPPEDPDSKQRIIDRLDL